MPGPAHVTTAPSPIVHTILETFAVAVTVMLPADALAVFGPYVVGLWTAPKRSVPKPKVDTSRIQRQSLDLAVEMREGDFLNLANAISEIYAPGSEDIFADYSKSLYVDTGVRKEFEASSSSPVQREGCTKGKSAVHYLPLDGLGRAQGMFACLNGGDFNYITDGDDEWVLDTDPTQIVGTRTEYPINKEHIPQGYYGGGAVHRGHILGRQLGGDGEDLRNLVPLYRDVKMPLMKGCEDKLAARLRTEETIYYEVIPHYEGKSGMPDYLILTWAGNKKGSGSVRLDDVP